MALFTDFFPTAGQQISSNDAGRLDDGNLMAISAASAAGLTTLTVSALGAAIPAGSIISITVGSGSLDGMTFAGVVDANAAEDATSIVVLFPEPPIASTGSAQTGLSGSTYVATDATGNVVIEGDQTIAGDTYTAGDTTNHGDLTQNGDITHNGDSFTSTAGDITLGDTNGNAGDDVAVYGDTITLGNTNTSTTTIAGDDITLGSTGSTTEITLNGPVNFPGIETSDATEIVGLDANDHLVSIIAGNGLTYTHSSTGASTLSVSSTFGGQTHVYATTAGASQTAATALGNLVSAFDTAGTAANGITVTAGTTFSHGDLILLTHGASSSRETEAYIFTGSNTTADATANSNAIANTDFADITHAGDVVETLRAGDNITIGDAPSGDETGSSATTPVINLDLTNSASGELLFDNAGVLDGSAIVQSGTGSSLALTATAPMINLTGQVAISSNTTIGGNLVANGEANVIGDVADGGSTTILGNQFTVGAFTIGDSSTNANVQFNALSYNVASSGVNFNDAEGQNAGFNVNSTGNTSIGGNFTTVSGSGNLALNSTATTANAIDVNSSGGIDVDAEGVINIASGTSSINMAHDGALSIAASGITGGANRYLTIGTNGVVGSAVVDVQGSISGTANTLPKYQADGTGLDDSAITQQEEAAISFTGYGLQTSAAGALEIRDITSHTPSADFVGRQITLESATGTPASLDSATGQTYTILSVSGTNFYTLTADGAFGNSISTIFFATGEGEIEGSVNSVTIGTSLILEGLNVPANMTYELVADSNGAITARHSETSLSGTGGTLPVYQADGNGIEDSLVSQVAGGETVLYGAFGVTDPSITPVSVSTADESNEVTYRLRLTDGDFTAQSFPADLDLTGQMLRIRDENAGDAAFQALINAGAHTVDSFTFVAGTTPARSDIDVVITVAGDGVRDEVLTSSGSGGSATLFSIAASTVAIDADTTNIEGGLLISNLVHTGAENANVVVTPSGELAIAGAGVAGGFNLVTATNAANAFANAAVGGSLALLTPISQNSIFYIPAAPAVGTSIEIANLSATGAGSGANRWQLRGINADGDAAAATNLMGLAIAADEEFTLDDNTASFKMTYTGATYGWVIIGAN